MTHVPTFQPSNLPTLVSPQPLRLRDPLQRNRIRRGPEGHASLLRQVPHPHVGFRKRRLQLPVHLLVGPAVLLQVLRPLLVANRHAARVREEVGDHRDTALLENQIGDRRRGLVRALHDDLAVDGARVGLPGDDAAQRRGDEPVTRNRPDLGVGDRPAAPPGHSTTGLPAAVWASSAGTSRPFSFTTPPETSDTAMTFAPASAWSSRARCPPTLPNPWMTTRLPLSGIPKSRAYSIITYITPRPVASSRPSDPPRETGLPVTAAGV